MKSKRYHKSSAKGSDRKIVAECGVTAFYITPMIGFSWGDLYGRRIWIGWLHYYFQFSLKDRTGGSQAARPHQLALK
jgi:hypothetical protein